MTNHTEHLGCGCEVATEGKISIAKLNMEAKKSEIDFLEEELKYFKERLNAYFDSSNKELMTQDRAKRELRLLNVLKTAQEW